MPDLHAQLVHWARTAPDRPAVVEAATGRRLTYGECLAAVQQMRQVLGAPPRNLTLSAAGGLVDAVLWLTALTGGYTLSPLEPDAATEERTRAARMFPPDVLIVEQAAEASAFPGAANAQVITRAECEALITQASATLAVPLDPVCGHVCLMTSGTTGAPKGVVLTADQVAWTAEHVRISHRLTPEDHGLTVLPFFHINGPVVGLCASIMAGSTIVVAPKFSRTHFWSWIEREQITWASIVPTIVAILLGTTPPAFLPGALRFMRTGAASLPPADLLAFETRFGVPLIETYGMSEAASQITANPVPPGRHKPGSAGLPAGVALRICRRREEAARLEDMPPGQTGEICISGPSVITAYYGHEDPEAFQNGWLRTGDLGYLDPDGYLFIQGRLRDVIIRGGENIAPREVEEVLESHPAVRAAAVIGRADPLYGEQVVAYVVPSRPWDPALAESVRAHAAGRLSAHKVPVEVIATDALPKNAMGKLEHRRLQREDAARQDAPSGEAAR